MKYFFILLLLCTYKIKCLGQDQQIEISGVLKTEQNEAIELATLVLKNKDKAYTTMSDAKGLFLFQINQLGAFELIVRQIGFKPFNKKLEIIGDSNLNDIQLKTETNLLKEVMIEGKLKPLVEKQSGMTIYNVGADPMAVGKSLAEVALNLPGLSLDNNDNININGDKRVTVLVNGRKSNINSSDILKQFQPESVEKIELISGADPRFASSEGAGVINIVLKKNRNKSINGSAALTANNFGFLNGAFNISKYTGRTNLYLKASSDDKFMRMISQTTRKNRNNNNTLFIGNIDNRLHHTLRNLITGLDFYIDSNNTLSIEHSISYHKDEMEAGAIQNFMNNNNLENNTNRLQSKPKEFENILSINHSHRFKNPKKWIESEVTGNVFNLNNQRLSQMNQQVENTAIESYAIRARSEYGMPIYQKNTLNMGVDLSLIELNNLSSVSEVNNKLNYSNNKAALFGSYLYQLNEAWSFRPGLRLEKSNTFAQQSKLAPVAFKYTSLYPTLNVVCNASENNSFSFDYIRKIDYPELNQYYTFLNQPDVLNVFVGNPNLLPAINNEFNLNVLLKTKNVNWNVSSFFHHVDDVMLSISKLDTNDRTLQYAENIGSEMAYGGNLSVNFNLLKKWKIIAMSNFSRSDLNLKANTYAAFKNTYNISGFITNRFTFSKYFDTECTYRLMSYYQSINEKSIKINHNLSFQCNYKINTAWTISLRANDLLNNVRFKHQSFPNENLVVEQATQSRIRYVQGTVSYKFGNKAKKRDLKLENDQIKFINE
jgi:outer membrane cobalamin receptor